MIAVNHNLKSSFPSYISKLLTTSTVLISLLLTACFNSEESKLTAEQEVESDRLMKEVEEELHLTEIAKPLLAAEHPKLYIEWGEDWMEIINTMIPLAAERVKSQSECDNVEDIKLSDKSEVGSNPILDISCHNAEIYSLSLADVTKEKRLYPASKLFGKQPNELIALCLQQAKAEFSYPDSLVYDHVNTIFNHISDSKDTVNLDSKELGFNDSNANDSNANGSTTKDTSPKPKEFIEKGIVEIITPLTVKTVFETKVQHTMLCTIGSDLNAKISLQ